MRPETSFVDFAAIVSIGAAALPHPEKALGAVALASYCSLTEADSPPAKSQESPTALETRPAAALQPTPFWATSHILSSLHPIRTSAVFSSGSFGVTPFVSGPLGLKALQDISPRRQYAPASLTWAAPLGSLFTLIPSHHGVLR